MQFFTTFFLFACMNLFLFYYHVGMKLCLEGQVSELVRNYEHNNQYEVGGCYEHDSKTSITVGSRYELWALLNYIIPSIKYLLKCTVHYFSSRVSSPGVCSIFMYFANGCISFWDFNFLKEIILLKEIAWNISVPLRTFL